MRIYNITEEQRKHIKTIYIECELSDQHRATLEKILERGCMTQTEMYILNNVILPSI